MRIAAVFTFGLAMSVGLIGQEPTQTSWGQFLDNENDDGSLVVLVAGLDGEGNWADFVRRLQRTGEDAVSNRFAFDQFDYLIYDSPDAQTIDSIFTELRGALTSHPRQPSGRLVFVGHSIGGYALRRFGPCQRP